MTKEALNFPVAKIRPTATKEDGLVIELWVRWPDGEQSQLNFPIKAEDALRFFQQLGQQLYDTGMI